MTDLSDRSSSFRFCLGPLEVYAYHDYPTHPWASPLYVGAWLWRGESEHGPGDLSKSKCVETMLPPHSRLRPFSGGRDDE